MSVKVLYQKVSDFQKKVDLSSQNSQCKKGCSRCCYVDLSVFEVEANLIRSWFKALEFSEKKLLLKMWARPLTRMVSFSDEEKSSCVFLKDECCTIYPVRPLICRTQGLGLVFKELSETFVDICPLNEQMLQELKAEDLLNLDLLNTMLSQLENREAIGKMRDRVSLKDLIEELKSYL